MAVISLLGRVGHPPDNLARDFLAVADSAGADRFAWYGYSWLAAALATSPS